MKCPHCKKAIGQVNFASLWWQKGTLRGKTIVELSQEVEKGQTIFIRCPKCGQSVFDHVVESQKLGGK